MNRLAHLAIGTRPDLLVDATPGVSVLTFERHGTEAATDSVAAQQAPQPGTAAASTVGRGATMRLGKVRDPLLLRMLTKAVFDGSQLYVAYSPDGIGPNRRKLTGSCRVTSLYTETARQTPALLVKGFGFDQRDNWRTDTIDVTFADGLTVEHH